MFSSWSLVKRSLLHHWRSNLAIAFGVAVATAVLSGALMVGDSMRSSLRELTLDRLAAVDQLLVSDGFFREELASDVLQLKVAKQAYDEVVPVIFFPGGTVENEAGPGVATRVTVFGINEDFAGLDVDHPWPQKMPAGQHVVINRALAADLGITNQHVEAGAASVTLRIPRRGQLPSDSSLGKKEDLIESLVRLKVDFILPTAGLGRFGLHPTQADPLNVYVPMELLQEALSRTVLKHKSSARQANMLMLSSKDGQLVSELATKELQQTLRPTLEDFGFILKRATLTFDSNDDGPKNDGRDDGSDDNAIVFDYWTLSSDRLVMKPSVAQAVQAAFPGAKPVFTYLANDIRPSATEPGTGIPFSMIASIDFDDSFQPRSARSGQPIKLPNENEIVLNEWAADDLQVTSGDSIAVTYFEPESKGGKQVERTTELVVADVARLVAPAEAPVVRRRGAMIPAVYDQRPAVANDMDLTPEVPGLTDAASIENWDLPFETADRIRSQDDDYWSLYRTTPKAFVSLKAGQTLWNSRFGSVTSFRIPASAGDQTAIEQRLSAQLIGDQVDTGLELVDIKRRGLAASSGSTPFDVLFLALSMFVIGSALILVALLFRLALQQRASQLGVLAAVGLDRQKVRRLFFLEMLCVAAQGSWIGVQLGVGYAALMVYGLTTWWVGAISRPFLTLHVSLMTLAIGLLVGLLVSALTLFWSLRSASKQNVVSLLSGTIQDHSVGTRAVTTGRWIVWLLLVIAIGLSLLAATLAGEPQAGAFMGAGFFVLAALLLGLYQLLSGTGRAKTQVGGGVTGVQSPGAPSMNVTSLAMLASRSAARNPLRSSLTVGLVAVASFLIVAVSSFRLSPSASGTAGFDWIATTSQPVTDPVVVEVENVAQPLATKDVASQSTAAGGTPEIFSCRYQAGEDASCNNLYQSTQPQVLGVPQALIDSFDPANAKDRTPFAWGGTQASTDVQRANPWRLLDGAIHAGTLADPIPVLIDKNTANYSLKIFMPGTVFEVDYDSGETVHFVAVGFLANTILQGSLITSEQNFLGAFPSAAGYRYFLIREAGESRVAARLEEELQDYGFDARSAETTLAGFMSVQNTYLSTFQSLGGLGLLLGTFGLAAVQIRSVLERKRELALMQAIGFGRGRLARMILLENAWLLLAGLGIGLAAALFSTLPHWFIGSVTLPWLELVIIFVAILVAGLLAAGLASRTVARLPLLESLRV